MERRAAELEEAEELFRTLHPIGKSMLDKDKANLSRKSRKMGKAIEDAIVTSPESYRTPTKNMHAVAGALIRINFPDGHPDKKRWEKGMEYLKTKEVQHDTYALSKSHAWTSDDVGS